MKDYKLLNLKNMKETIVNYSGDQKEFDKIWDAFYQMACIGFISQDTWIKFFDSGKVKANIFPVEAATKPESMKEENLMCDEYRDFFDTFEEAAAWANQAHRA